jgi:PAS domain S-box-containing protein
MVMGKASEHEQPVRWRPSSRAVLSGLLHQSPVPALVATLDGKILDINAIGPRLMGYKKDYLLERQVRELCTERDEWEAIERGAGKDRILRYAHLHLRKKDGSQIDCLVAVKAIEQHGERARLCFLWDFTLYAKKIRGLEDARERDHLLATMERDSLWTSEFDHDGNVRVTYMSEPIANIMGYTTEEIRKMTLDQMVMPSSAKAADEHERGPGRDTKRDRRGGLRLPIHGILFGTPGWHGQLITQAKSWGRSADCVGESHLSQDSPDQT